MVITNGVIHTMTGPVIPGGFVAWQAGHITAVGPMEALPERGLGEVLDAAGGHVTPGYIDAHCHLGLFPDAQRYDDARFNGPEPLSFEFDPLERANLADRCFAEALAAGVTTAVIGPGSKNPVGGKVACVKTDGTVRNRALAIKAALGETPEGAAGLDADALARLLSDALAGQGAKPVHLHVHRASDMMAALEMKRRLGLELVFVHATEGHLLARAIAEAGVPVIAGPIMTDRSKEELKNATVENPARLAAAGVRVALCTDHPETPAQYLPLCAALAVRGGLSEEAALAAITKTPAEILGLKELGALAPGKAADLVVTPGHPLDPTKAPSAVILGGKRVL